jgi:hypothetical protein
VTVLRWLGCAALVACAHAPPKHEDAYPMAYAGPPPHPFDSAVAFVHRALERARASHEAIQVACLRDKESKLDALGAERDSLVVADVDARAQKLQSDAERCVTKTFAP